MYYIIMSSVWRGESVRCDVEIAAALVAGNDFHLGAEHAIEEGGDDIARGRAAGGAEDDFVGLEIFPFLGRRGVPHGDREVARGDGADP